MGMIREFMLWINETLFYLTNGVMLVNTPWIFLWVLFWGVLMTIPIIYATSTRPKKWRVALPLMIFFSLFSIFSLTTAISPGIIQMQMMQECRIDIAEFNIIKDGNLEEQGEIEIKQCRYKDNYYSEFGDWKIYRGDR